MIKKISVYAKCRLNKKQKAAKYYGVRLDDLTEYRGWVPTTELKRLNKYVSKLKPPTPKE